MEKNMTEKKKTKVAKRKSIGGGVFNFIGTLMIVVTILLCLVIALPRIAGINGYVVVSGSMEPKIPVGSIVYARKCEPSSVQKGEVIVFYDSLGNTVPVTHRVVENRSEQGEIITKGDANATEDFAPVRYENVIGGERSEKGISRSSVEYAYQIAKDGNITGPKQLKINGASYVYAIFMRLGIIDPDE